MTKEQEGSIERTNLDKDHEVDEVDDEDNEDDSNSYDSENLLSMELPKRILEKGKFIGSEKKVLWSPPHESKKPFSNIWKFGGNFLWSIIPHRQPDPNEANLQQSHHSPPSSREENDVESQFHPAFSQMDGIYVPPLHTSQKFDDAGISYGDRILSRFERDGIPTDREQKDIPGKWQNPNFEYCRPENIQDKSFNSASNQEQDEVSTNSNTEQEGTSYSLLIDLDKTKFNSHPSLLEEERLVQDLELIYMKLKTLNDYEVMKNHEIRLSAIINEVVRNNALESDGSEYKNDIGNETDEGIHLVIYHEFLTLTSKMAELELESYSLYSKLLKKWEKILRVREIQGFQSTTHSLSKSSFCDSSNEVSEIIFKQMEHFRKHIKHFAEKVNAPSTTPDSVTSNLQNALDTVQMVLSNRNTRVDVVLCSGDESCLTAASDYTLERKRRESICAEHYYAKLFIDGQLVGSTRTVQLEWPSLEVNFNKQFKVFLGKYPEAVCVQIYRKRFLRNDHLISTIYINTPGDKCDFSRLSLELLAPSTEWYRFSEASIIEGSGGRYLVEGHVLITSQWNKEDQYLIYPNEHPDSNVINPTKFKSCGKIYVGIEQYREREAQKSRAVLGGSENDEELATMTPSVRAALNDASLRFTVTGTKHSFLNSSLLKEPVRHQLIKQRNNNQFSQRNNFQIPLLECDVDADAAQFAADSRIRSRIENVSKYFSISIHFEFEHF